MSTFRPPPAPRLPSDIESNTATDPLRQRATKFGSSPIDDVPPMSTRYDKPAPANPPAHRPSSPAMNAIARPLPASANSAASTPIPAARLSKGGIYQVTRILEKRHGAFFISRLILASGINLRGFDADTTDDPAIVSKFVKSLRNMLSPADMAGLFSQAPSLMNMK